MAFEMASDTPNDTPAESTPDATPIATPKPSEAAPADAPPSEDTPPDAAAPDTPAPDAAPAHATPPDNTPSNDAAPANADPMADAMLETTTDPHPAMAANDQASLDAEIERALEGVSLVEDVTSTTAGRGKRPRMEGTIVQVRGEEVLVEFGPRTMGVCPLSNFEKPPTLGSRMEFTVDRVDHDDEMLVLSRKGAISKAKWKDITEGQVIEAVCTGTNKGGLDMEVSGHKAFMPAGQVDLRHIPDLSGFVGQKLPCEVMELDHGRGRMVLSRKSVLHAQRKVARDELLATLEVGQSFDGVVTSVQDYGVFVDIGGLDGLVHVSDMSWDRVSKPGDLVKEGEAVRVQVLKIDTGKDPIRIGLGMKQLVEDPFTSAAGGLAEGAVVSGTVTRLENFGAFVKLDSGVEGLVHISELDHKRVNRVSQVVKTGEKVEVKVLSIDTDRHRIALSLKQARGDASASGDGTGSAGRALRDDDPMMRKLRANFGDGPLKGGIG